MGRTTNTDFLTRVVTELARRFGRAQFVRDHPSDGKTHVIVDENETDLGHRVRY